MSTTSFVNAGIIINAHPYIFPSPSQGGITLVISPLLSLIDDQVNFLKIEYLVDLLIDDYSWEHASSHARFPVSVRWIL